MINTEVPAALLNAQFPIVRKTPKTTFLVDVTTDPAILDQVYSLRYKVFNLELGEGLASSHETQRDVDQYDQHSVNLVVIDQTLNQVVGTYRIMPQQNALDNIGFYSENEFDLSTIYEHLPHAAEIGRCCIHPEYRSGMVMNLLWYGIGLYMEKFQVSHLFGCTSMNKGDTSEQASLIYKICETVGAIVDNDLIIKPQPGHFVEGFDRNIELPKIAGNPKRLLPTLMRGYIAIGAILGGEPAYDPEFDVIDFFTLFAFSNIAKAAKRFFPSS